MVLCWSSSVLLPDSFSSTGNTRVTIWIESSLLDGYIYFLLASTALQRKVQFLGVRHLESQARASACPWPAHVDPSAFRLVEASVL